MTERRAAFDVGSGSTKLQCAVIDTATGKIVEKLFGVERPQAYGIALQQSKDGHLSEDIQQTGVDLFVELKQTAVEEYGCTRFAAVATEVFRRAKNGADVLERLQKTTGLRITYNYANLTLIQRTLLPYPLPTPKYYLFYYSLFSPEFLPSLVLHRIGNYPCQSRARG